MRAKWASVMVTVLALGWVMSVQGALPWLQFTEESVQVKPGERFVVGLELVVPVGFDYAGVVGLDWWLATDRSGADALAVVGRTLEGGFSFSYDTAWPENPDWPAVPAGLWPQAFSVADVPGAPWQVRNEFPLGAIRGDLTSAGTGTWLVSVIECEVPLGAMAGNYPLVTTVPIAGLGWVAVGDLPGWSVAGGGYGQHASMDVLVIPEPQWLAVLAAAGLLVWGLMVRRPGRRRV